VWGTFGHSDVSCSRCWYRINTWSSVPLYLAHRSANILKYLRVSYTDLDDLICKSKQPLSPNTLCV